jgi:hypothetical protein
MPLKTKSIIFADNTTLSSSFANVFITGTDSFLKVGGSLQGEISGYTSGGYIPALPTVSNVIDKFPFSTNSNASTVGNLTVRRLGSAGQSSTVSGYNSGGLAPPSAPSPIVSNVVDKFPFAANANATDVGDLTVARYYVSGQSSTVSGYTSGGTSPYSNVIDKFPFATDANATDVGDLTLARAESAGQSSVVSGYTSGGYSFPPSSYYNVIDKFPFSTNANATDVGDLVLSRYGMAGQSSSISGYTSSGTDGSTSLNIIDKFPFAANANATDVGDLSVVRYRTTGQSSVVSGYNSGGTQPFPFNPFTSYNIIDKFPFAVDANATDVGDLTVARYSPAGQQV